ncbi:Protein phosphatase 1 regulatory subunit 3B [Physocladia obscura]|uniref:Protein phosphatase 1 regulatory subunit 3B n=1 Tax=Physocladia obscura TaxID=109957 RepID=A0AAD5T3P9_9FUNG|nr:Protein phosphatase 1 regulatory subunit 3B [Physocladia obscura]
MTAPTSVPAAKSASDVQEVGGDAVEQMDQPSTSPRNVTNEAQAGDRLKPEGEAAGNKANGTSGAQQQQLRLIGRVGIVASGNATNTHAHTHTHTHEQHAKMVSAALSTAQWVSSAGAGIAAGAGPTSVSVPVSAVRVPSLSLPPIKIASGAIGIGISNTANGNGNGNNGRFWGTGTTAWRDSHTKDTDREAGIETHKLAHSDTDTDADSERDSSLHESEADTAPDSAATSDDVDESLACVLTTATTATPTFVATSTLAATLAPIPTPTVTPILIATTTTVVANCNNHNKGSASVSNPLDSDSTSTSDDLSSTATPRPRSVSPNARCYRPILKKSSSTPLVSSLSSSPASSPSLLSSPSFQQQQHQSSVILPSCNNASNSNSSRAFYSSKSVPNLFSASSTPDWSRRRLSGGSVGSNGRRDSVKSLSFDNVIKEVCFFSSDESPARIAQSPRYPESSDDFSSPDSDIDDIQFAECDSLGYGFDAEETFFRKKPTTQILEPWIVQSRSVSEPHTLAPVVSLDSIRLSHSTSTTVISSTTNNLSRNAVPQRLMATIVVRNLAYVKQVKIRYTFDAWKSYCDTLATFSGVIIPSNSATAGLDRFQAVIDMEEASNRANTPLLTATISGIATQFFSSTTNDTQQYICFDFAVCAEMNGMAYWDNNAGRNHQMILTRGVHSVGLVSAATAALMAAGRGQYRTVEDVIVAAQAAAVKSGEIMAVEAEAIKRDFEIQQQKIMQKQYQEQKQQQKQQQQQQQQKQQLIQRDSQQQQQHLQLQQDLNKVGGDKGLGLYGNDSDAENQRLAVVEKTFGSQETLVADNAGGKYGVDEGKKQTEERCVSEIGFDSQQQGGNSVVGGKEISFEQSDAKLHKATTTTPTNFNKNSPSMTAPTTKAAKGMVGSTNSFGRRLSLTKFSNNTTANTATQRQYSLTMPTSDYYDYDDAESYSSSTRASSDATINIAADRDWAFSGVAQRPADYVYSYQFPMKTGGEEHEEASKAVSKNQHCGRSAGVACGNKNINSIPPNQYFMGTNATIPQYQNNDSMFFRLTTPGTPLFLGAGCSPVLGTGTFLSAARFGDGDCDGDDELMKRNVAKACDGGGRESNCNDDDGCDDDEVTVAAQYIKPGGGDLGDGMTKKTKNCCCSASQSSTSSSFAVGFPEFQGGGGAGGEHGADMNMQQQQQQTQTQIQTQMQHRQGQGQGYQQQQRRKVPARRRANDFDGVGGVAGPRAVPRISEDIDEIVVKSLAGWSCWDI